MSQLAYRRNAATIERLAIEIQKQCGFWRRNTANGASDDVRFLLILQDAERLRFTAEKAAQRYEREHPL